MKLKQHWLLGLWMIFSLWGCGSKEPGSIETSFKPQNPVSEERPVEAAEVIPQSVSYTISAVGSLKTPENVIVSTKKGGIIARMLVREGDRVKKGEVLVQLDDVDARLQIERAEARVKEVEASLETNQTTLIRYQRLLESKVIPQQTYDDMSLKVKLDDARVTLAKAELNMARQNLLDHQIVSPIDGVINLKIASLGEYVNVAPKDEILTIVQMDPLELEFYVPENWVGKIRIGSKIQFTVKAFPEEKFSATVQSISPAADSTTRNIKMKAMVQNPHYRLKPGFFVEASVQTGGNPNALVIPESALFSQEGKFFVFVVLEGAVHRKEIDTGQRFNGQVEIIRGIRKGERVVTAGHEQLSDGMKVRMKNERDSRGNPKS